jgi:glutamate racemase
MMSAKQPHILVFDSGVGGLSIVEAIKKINPYCQLTYASDNAQFPYGTKSASELTTRVEKVLKRLQEKVLADIIVIACNSASTLVLPTIRSNFLQPIIGVVPAIKPAAKITANNVVGLLATPGTIHRDYTKKLIKDFASHCKIISIGSSELVILAERKLQGKSLSLEVLSEIVAPFHRTKNACRPDTIVLACTHFPLLKDELMSVLPHTIHWIDSGDAIGRRIEFWIKELKLNAGSLTIGKSSPGHSIFTKRAEAVELIRPALIRLGIDYVSYLEVS